MSQIQRTKLVQLVVRIDPGLKRAMKIRRQKTGQSYNDQIRTMLKRSRALVH